MADQAQEMSRIEEALASFDSGIVESYEGTRLMRDSLERRFSQLAATVRGRLDLSLTREGGTGAELSLVSAVLSSFQASLSAIAQVLGGDPTSRGSIPAAITESVELRVVAAQPGSLHLQLVPAAASPDPLFEDSQETLLEASMDRLLGLLAEDRTDREDLLQDVADLGSRTTKHVEALSRVFAEGRATANFDWRSPSLTSSVIFHADRAQGLRGLLREVEESEDDEERSGRLVGGSLPRRTFELELATGALITGRAAEGTLEALEALFGQDVTATLLVRQSWLSSGERKETYVLESLVPQGDVPAV